MIFRRMALDFEGYQKEEFCLLVKARLNLENLACFANIQQ